MKPTGYVTQCAGDDKGGWGEPPCPNTTRLTAPSKWRCSRCESQFGKLVKP